MDHIIEDVDAILDTVIDEIMHLVDTIDEDTALEEKGIVEDALLDTAEKGVGAIQKTLDLLVIRLKKLNSSTPLLGN